MLFSFMDESGHPHPKDAATRPVLINVCINAHDMRSVSIGLFRLKRRILQRDQGDFEAKAKELITRGTFRNRPEKREFVESFFEMCRNLPLVIFAVIMEKPQSPLTSDIDFLPMQFRDLLYRVNRLLELETEKSLGAIFFDGDGSQYNKLSVRFSNWLYMSRGGQSLVNLGDSPFFVDSRFTSGIQIADMSASVVRIYEENGLNRGAPAGDDFLSAISRFYRIIKEKTRDLEAPTGDFTWYGFDYMPERRHYEAAQPEAKSEKDYINESEKREG